MKFSAMCAVTAVTALLAGFTVAGSATEVQAQLFNSSNGNQNDDAPVYNSGNNNRGGAQPLFLNNNSGGTRSSRFEPFESKPRTVDRYSNGFNSTLNSDSVTRISELDRRIAESAMDRMARAEALKAQIRADTARKKAQLEAAAPGAPEDPIFGAGTESVSDGRPQVYDEYNRDPTAPGTPNRLFNTSR